MISHRLCSRSTSRWRHTTRRGRVTRARWSSSSQIQTDPAAPAGLSSEEESCPTASRWPGVSVSSELPLTLYQYPSLLNVVDSLERPIYNFTFPHCAVSEQRWMCQRRMTFQLVCTVDGWQFSSLDRHESVLNFIRQAQTHHPLL